MKPENPKPFDLKVIYEIVEKTITTYKVPKEVIRVDYKKAREILKQRIKQACEFYLRYKDNMNLLLKEQDKNGELIRQIKELDSKQTWENYHDWTIRMISLYNEWLFKLAFKGVFKND